MTVKNVLTFDIEAWYHANYGPADFQRFRHVPSRLAFNVERFMALCDRYGVRSTCFVLGSVAETEPDLVKRLSAAGHEIASHGYGHEPVFALSPEAFREDVRRSCTILGDLTGKPVLGYRAPSWSVTRDVLPWFYPTLEAEGILYSSSVYPGKTFLYGVPDFPVHAARPVVGRTQSRVLEWPVPVFSVPGRRIGFSGGFFLRLFPVWFIKAMIRRRNRAGRPVFLYFHPRELDPDGPRLKLRAKERFIHYYGVNGAGLKLQQIIRGLPGRFARIKDILHCPSGNPRFPNVQ